MIEDALGTTDTDERLAKYADIQNYIVDEVCPSAWLCDFQRDVLTRALMLPGRL